MKDEKAIFKEKKKKKKKKEKKKKELKIRTRNPESFEAEDR